MPGKPSDTRRDEELIDACLAGDDGAWAALVQRYQRLIYTIPLRFGMPLSAADEIFQEVCLSLLQNLDAIRDKQRLSAWLVTVTRRLCIEHWRRPEAPGNLEQLNAQLKDDAPPLDDRLVAVEERHTLQLALEQLDERCRYLLEVLFLRENPLSYADIARELDIPEGNIGPTRARCLAKLRKFIVNLERNED